MPGYTARPKLRSFMEVATVELDGKVIN